MIGSMIISITATISLAIVGICCIIGAIVDFIEDGFNLTSIVLLLAAAMIVGIILHLFGI